jgi:AraC-like DNA-binding protein
MLKDTFMDYYQLDVGALALDGVPGGTALLERLAFYGTADSFLRPEESDIREMMRLCEQLQEHVQMKNMPMSFAKTVELLSLLCRLYGEGGKQADFYISAHTQKVLKYMESNYFESVTIAKLSKVAGVSASYLSRIFRQETGMGVHEYLNRYRISKASVLLHTQNISDVAYQCGFSDCSHFISVFKKQFRCTPKAYQKRLQTN